MSKAKEKRFQTQELPKTKWFWAISLAGILGVILGVFLLPIWGDTSVFWKDWGKNGVSIILCVIITIYVLAYLCKGFREIENSTLKIISVIEIAILCLLAIGCVLQQFNVFSFFGPCFVFGLALWHRGFFNIVKGYLSRRTKKAPSLWMIIFSVVMVTAGAILMVKPIAGNAFIWFSSIALLFVSVIMFVGGFMMKPKKQNCNIE